MGRLVIKKRNKKYLRSRRKEIARVWMDYHLRFMGGELDDGYHLGDWGFFSSSPEAQELVRKYNLPISSIEDIGRKGYEERNLSNKGRRVVQSSRSIHK